MAVAIRQAFEQANSITTAVTSQTASFPSATLAGSTIIVFATYSYNVKTAATCSDSVNGSYIQANTVDDFSNAGQAWLSTYYFANAASTTAVTFAHASDTYSGFIAIEVTGLTVNSFIASNAHLQAGITGSTADNINTGAISAGAGAIFLVAASMMTTENGTAPYFPTPGTGYTLGGHWFANSDVGGASIATWQYTTINNPGSTTPTFTSPSGSANDNYLTAGLAFSIAGGINPLGGNGIVAWIV